MRSVNRKPAASSKSSPGVRIVTLTAVPPTRISSGSSTATSSCRCRSSSPFHSTTGVLLICAVSLDMTWRGSEGEHLQLDGELVLLTEAAQRHVTRTRHCPCSLNPLQMLSGRNLDGNQNARRF